MFLESHLTEIGFTQKEAQVYLAALEIGTASVQELATKSMLKRPTVYVILEQLKQKGFIQEEKKGKGSHYRAANPDVLKRKTQEQSAKISEAMPFLQMMYKKDQGKPHVDVYEGIEGIKQVYFDLVWKSNTEILFFSSIRKTYESIPGLLEYWLEAGLTHPNFQKQMREFINPEPTDIAYAKKAMKQNPDLAVRMIPKQSPFQFVGTDNAIFEDKIMMVCFEEKLFTTVIQSKPIADSLRVLYELAWSTATPLESVFA
jgi:sugar-specific transcriptional regulator TrmB